MQANQNIYLPSHQRRTATGVCQRLFQVVIFFGLVMLQGFANAAASDRVSLDYAYYNPLSLLIKDKGWLEEELAADNIEVRWIHTQGSNRALEFLRASAIDFGSTAGSAALVGLLTGYFFHKIKATFSLQ